MDHERNSDRAGSDSFRSGQEAGTSPASKPSSDGGRRNRQSPEPASPHALGENGVERPLLPALLRGWRGRCPNCGGGPILRRYLSVRDHCPSCGEPLHYHRADDLPAWATILIVGHIVGSALLYVETEYTPPTWVHWAIWPALTIGLAMWMLPRVKGAVVAMQWAWRMHGFDPDSRPEDHHPHG